MPNFNFSTSILPTSDNTFSLGSASKRWKINDQEITFDTIYPIGSIYISINNVNPSTFFGGTWEQIEDKFLLSAGSTYTAGNTGGSASNSHTHTMAHTHTQVATTSGGPSNNTSGSTAITTAQMPSHRHLIAVNEGSSFSFPASSLWIYRPFDVGGGSHNAGYTNTAGSGQGHTHTLSSHTHSTSATTTGGASNATTSDASNTNNMPPYIVVYMWKRTA